MSDQSQRLVLGFLAAHGAEGVSAPTHAELKLGGVLVVAARCADLRSQGNRLRVLANPPVALADDPWREIFGIAGSIGESLMLAAGCEVEAEWLRRARAAHALPDQMMLGQRFFSESEAQLALGIGHRLFNLVLRAVAVDRELRAKMLESRDLKQWAEAHRPRVDTYAAWESLNKSRARALRRVVAGFPHPSVRSLVAVPACLAVSAAWRDLDETRGREFHRWRVESSVVAGLDATSGYTRDVVGAGGEPVGHRLTSAPVRYSEADGREEAVASVARSALLAVAASVDRVLVTLGRAVEPLSKGHLISADGSFGTRLGFDWDAAQCGCCAAS